MKQYLNYTVKGASTPSFKHSFLLVFKKIETVLFSFLCILFLVLSRAQSNFIDNLSFFIVETSLPIVNISALPFNTAINLTTNFRELVSAKKENKKLRNELNELRSFYIDSINIREENKELRQVLNFVSLKSSNFKVAKIIGKAHGVFNKVVYIDAGKNRDIKQGSIVTGNHGVIGRVAKVGEDKSKLILLSDPTSHIPVLASKARARGILVGNNAGLMEILYLPKDHTIVQGDWIFTSGDGDTLPSGLLVGIVDKVTQDYVGVKMVEDVSNVDIVTIIDY